MFGFPIPWKKLNGTAAKLFNKTPTARSCKTSELFSANFVPSHSSIPSNEKVTIKRIAGYKIKKINYELIK